MIEYDLAKVQDLCRSGNIEWSTHIFKRMRERRIKTYEVLGSIYNGEMIERYPDDKPLPSCLVYGVVDSRNIHTVLSSDLRAVYLITTYEPDLTEWESDYKTRRRQL